MKFNNIIFSEVWFNDQPSAWIEHYAFAFFLVEKLKPNVFVELGTHYGGSYFAFCQAIKTLQLKTKTYAVDTWIGDEHAGFYGQEVFQHVSHINQEHFAWFSNLLKATFKDAAQLFEEGSIDLLHIDGLHTYEAVKHDFETWLPKMSDSGVIIFHDTAMKEKGFGVWKLMEELRERYPYFEFEHGYGLGVLCTGSKINEDILTFFETASDDFAKNLFSAIGRKNLLEYQEKQQNERIEALSNDLEAKNQSVRVKDEANQKLRQNLIQQKQQIQKTATALDNLQNTLEIKTQEIQDLKTVVEQTSTRNASLDQINIELQKRLNDKTNANERLHNHINILIGKEQELETSLEKTKEQLGKSKSVIDGLEQKLRYSEILINAITNSPSWKITAPFRKLKKFLKFSYFFLLPQRRLIAHSGLFDKQYYLDNNPDVTEASMSAIRHFLVHGGQEDRDPSTLFDTSFYLDQNPDVKASGINPLVHYLKFGMKEGRSPFSGKNPQASEPQQITASSKSKIIKTGAKIIQRIKGCTDLQLLMDSEYFNAEYYLRMNPDVNAAGIDPAEHYLYHGWKEGLNPSELFNTSFYLKKYRDVSLAKINPLLHFIQFGKSENRICIETSDNYTLWIKMYDTLSPADIMEMKEALSLFKAKPLISVIMPVFNSNHEWLKEAIDSVINQIYPFWELCIADDCSTDVEIKDILEYYRKTDSRIKVIYRTTNGHISASSNSALELAIGEFVALLDHDDILPIHALYWVANAINMNPGAKLFYSDEDKIDENGVRQNPYFKCDWNPELFYSQNMINHFGIYKTGIMRNIGGFRIGFEGSQDYDLALRFIEQIDSIEIFHIPKVLYHWRLHDDSTSRTENCKTYAYVSGEKALNEHFRRIKKEAFAKVIRPGMYRLKYPLPSPEPHITIIIPTKDQVNLLRNCIKSVLEKTTYTSFDIIIIDNESNEPESVRFLDEVKKDKRITCIRDNRPFNYSALNNIAVSAAKGEFVCLLNNDIEVINSDWLIEMVSIASQPGIGAVGAKLYFPDEHIQHAGVILGIGGVAGHAHKFFFSKSYGYFGRAVLMQEMSALTGACMVVKRSVYLEAGGLDELNLPIAFNDVDFCLKLKKAGYRNIWTPCAELYHHESVSRGSENTEEKKTRFKKEGEYMKSKWGSIIETDPAYNPNLTLISENFELAWPPRNTSSYSINKLR